MITRRSTRQGILRKAESLPGKDAHKTHTAPLASTSGSALKTGTRRKPVGGWNNDPHGLVRAASFRT